MCSRNTFNLLQGMVVSIGTRRFSFTLPLCLACSFLVYSIVHLLKCGKRGNVLTPPPFSSPHSPLFPPRYLLLAHPHRNQVRLTIFFPSHYPSDAPPSFTISPDTLLSISQQAGLKKACLYVRHFRRMLDISEGMFYFKHLFGSACVRNVYFAWPDAGHLFNVHTRKPQVSLCSC